MQAQYTSFKMNLDEKSDKEILEEYKKLKPWGLYASIDLKNCNPETIRSKEKIRGFIVKLCELIDMKRFGEPQIVNFGEEERVAGYSFTQLIETSLISGHLANQSNAVYIDIFSCKAYEPKKAAEFCKEFFKADSYKINVSFRF